MDPSHRPRIPAPPPSMAALRRPAPQLRRAGDGAPVVPMKLELGVANPGPPKVDPEPVLPVEEDYAAMFRDEAAEYLPPMAEALGRLMEDLSDAKAWEVMRVKCHTIKGSAASIGLQEASEAGAVGEKLAKQALARDEDRTRETLRELHGKVGEIAEILQLEVELPVWQEGASFLVEEDHGIGMPAPADGGLPLVSGLSGLLGKASAEADAWSVERGNEEIHDRLVLALEDFRAALAGAGVQDLAFGVGQLAIFIRTVEPGMGLPDAVFVVLRGCLGDARMHLKALEVTPGLGWNRKWGHYFSSLRVVLASEGGKIPVSTPSAGNQVGGEEVDPEMLETFLEEASGIFEQIEASLLEWESADDPEGPRAAVRRHFHTLKGAANSIGLRRLGDGFHALEDYIESLSGKDAPEKLFSFLLGCLDQVKAYAQSLAVDPRTLWNHDWKGRIAALESGESGTPAPEVPEAGIVRKEEPEKQMVRVDAAKLRDLMTWMGELIAERSRFESKLGWLSELRISVSGLHEKLDLSAATGPAEAGLAREAGGMASSLARFVASLKDDELEFRRTAKRIQGELAGMNMAPVAPLFRRLQRAFRDAVVEEKKEAELALEGVETCVDRSVIEQLYGPLLHIVRNAVAHGIESPQRRREAGKASMGRVKLAAVAKSNEVHIIVEDDGAGIDVEAVRRRAIERGLLPAGAGPLSDQGAVQLLFAPGFSTKETVSSVAGRGVGLDVVKQEIEALKGSVSVNFEKGRGAIWLLRVPMSLSAAEALLVKAGDQVVAVPLNHVDRCILLAGRVKEEEGRDFVLYGEEWLPAFSLAGLLSWPVTAATTHGVVVEADGKKSVLTVQGLVARREIVSRDLGPVVGQLPYLAGATPDADGSMICILQISKLLERVGISGGLPSGEVSAEKHDEAVLEAAEEENFSVPEAPPRVLLSDDSPSVRKMEEKILKELGFEVVAVEDGQASLERLPQEKFDLIVTDLEMPRLDGVGLAKAVHGLPGYGEFPIILVTSCPEEHDNGSKSAAWLAKPLQKADLIKALLEKEKLKPFALKLGIREHAGA